MNASAEDIFEATRVFTKALQDQGYSPVDIKAGIKAWLINEDVELPTEKSKDRLYKKKDIRQAWKRQRSICPECAGILIDPNLNSSVDLEDRTEGDHYQPWAKGGTTTTDNLRAIHRKCHSAKGAKEPVQYSKSSGKTILESIRGTGVGEEDAG